MHDPGVVVHHRRRGGQPRVGAAGGRVVELVLPEEVVGRWDSTRVGARTMVYADVEIGGLAVRTDCIIGVAGSEVLIGQIVN